MRKSLMYLVFSLVGFILPYSQFVPFLLEHGLSVGLMIDLMFVNRISAFFSLDVLVSAVVLLLFIVSDGKKLGTLRVVPILGIFLVGVSLGLPLYLYLKSKFED